MDSDTARWPFCSPRAARPACTGSKRLCRRPGFLTAPAFARSPTRRPQMSNTVVTIDSLHERVDAIFHKAGLNAIQANAIARVIVAAERDACKSHGVYRIEGALRTIKAAKVNPHAVPELLPQDAPA